MHGRPGYDKGLLLWVVGAALVGVSCKGDDQSTTEPPAEAAPTLAANATQPLSFYQVSAGIDPYHTCAVTTTNRAYCWGTGYLGDGPASSHKRPTPVAVTGGHQFRQISSGYNYTCAVTTDNRAFCWGDNYAGQLGDGTQIVRPTPVPVVTGLRFRQVSAGHNATCGLSTEDRIYCWGSSYNGLLGTGTAAGTWKNPPAEIAGGRRYRHVSTGYQHNCAVTNSSQTFCWGRNDSGQLGDNSTARVRLKPVLVSGGSSYRQVSAGYDHTCAVTTTNRAYCWGYGGYGAIGDGKTLSRWAPREVAGGVLFERVTAGVSHTCGETIGNRAYCWGYNGYGNLGDGTKTSRTKPAPVAGGLRFGMVNAGNGYSCGVTSENRGYCWGENDNGTLGDGTTTHRSVPTPIAGAT